MSNDIDSAALAFDRDMGGAAAPQPNIRERASAPEPIFGNSDDPERDISAGGDNEPDPKPKRERKSKEEPNEEDEEDYLYADPDDDGASGEEGGDEDEDEESEDEDDELLSRKFRVMVDGEEEEITLREAIDGGIRTKTFHKRLNQLDSARKELSTHAAKIIEDRQRHDTMLAEAEEILSGILPQEPDWDKLFQEDPKAAHDLRKQYDAYRGQITAIREKRAKAQKDEAESAARESAEYARTEFPKFAAIAKWRNKEEMQKDIASMRKSALSLGFSEEEVGQVFDHRMLTVLLKASKYDRMMAAKPKSVKTGKTPVNPGAGSKGTARRGIIGAQKNLARSGSIDDAADVFAKIIR